MGTSGQSFHLSFSNDLIVGKMKL